MTQALVLNASYQPVRIIDWQKALILWFQGKVEILEFHEIEVHSPSQSFPLPAVLKFKKYFRPYFSFGVKFSRKNIFLRDKNICQYCCKKFPEKQLTLDHVIPLSRGGAHNWTNVVTACSACNNKKGAMSLKEANLRLLKKPIKPKFLQQGEIPGMKSHLPETWVVYLGQLKASP
ncbi:HNH endonuclease [bacterium]|nr:HNH endonuclease [bacterium]